MQTLNLILAEFSIIYGWVIAVIIHPFFWTLSAGGAKFERVFELFFSSKLRALILSEVLGLCSTLLSIVLSPDSYITFLGITVFMQITLVIGIACWYGGVKNIEWRVPRSTSAHDRIEEDE